MLVFPLLMDPQTQSDFSTEELLCAAARDLQLMRGSRT